jgi:hypothetical protein
MASAHRGMNISEGELLAALGGLKGDIVGR